MDSSNDAGGNSSRVRIPKFSLKAGFAVFEMDTHLYLADQTLHPWLASAKQWAAGTTDTEMGDGDPGRRVWCRRLQRG